MLAVGNRALGFGLDDPADDAAGHGGARLRNGVACQDLIQGAGQTAEEVGKVLANVYQLPQDVIATKTQQFLGYGSQGVAEALKGAGATANDTARILKDMGYQTAEITSVIRNVFTHVNVNLGHVDTPAGPHLDAATNHVDVPRNHVDTAQHADIPGSHTDFGTVFGHADQNITPHGDSNPHVDQTTTPHGDTTTPHVDSQTPPHVDTSTHIDA